MGEVTNQIAIVLGVLAACFAGPAAALFVLIRRKLLGTGRTDRVKPGRQTVGRVLPAPRTLDRTGAC